MLRKTEPPDGPRFTLARVLDRCRLLLRVAQVRLRFLFVLAAGFLIVGAWPVLRNYWDTFTLSPASSLVSGGVSEETEYFCPMCPGVVSVWPTKCSVCNMPLVRRKRSDAQQLPDGVLARMQLSPYRVHLAGIQTAPVDYQPLVREVMTRGTVNRSDEERHPATENGVPDDSATITAEIDQRDIAVVSLGTPAVVVPEIEMAGEPLEGRVSLVERKVAALTHRVRIEVATDDPRHELWPGMMVKLRLCRPMAELEPFRSQPADTPPLAEGEPRLLFTCHEHPHVLRTTRERCPEDDNLLMDRRLNELERVGWWCPMHPEVTATEAGHECQQCNGMKLVPRIVQYRPAGQVLAVPETAVVDLGDRRVVYLERMPGMFDAVEVVLGPRCGGYYPVVRGLGPRERVAATGAFLLDAETRLNPSVAAGYFGASPSTSSSAGQSLPGSAKHGNDHSAKEDAIRAALDKLPPPERATAERQKLCPMTGIALGSMGTPVKIDIGGQTVWLCCDGCESEALENPIKTLNKLKRALEGGVEQSESH
jgi:hypothetical protein